MIRTIRQAWDQTPGGWAGFTRPRTAPQALRPLVHGLVLLTCPLALAQTVSPPSSPYLLDTPRTGQVLAAPGETLAPVTTRPPGAMAPGMAQPAMPQAVPSVERRPAPDAPPVILDRRVSPIDVEYGQPRPIIDGVGWVVGIPRKLLLWDARADNHDVSHETVGTIADYLDARQLGDVKVRINQYDPIGEWRRLVANERISPGWKYTVGALYQIKYTLLPGRIFGGDEYNPYTNSLSMYSDLPGMGLAESAYAYDVHQRTYPGLYASVQILPLVSIWHETLATGEVLDYLVLTGTPEEQAATRRTLYARYGIELGGEVSRVLPGGALAYPILGAVGGHAYAAAEHYQRPPGAVTTSTVTSQTVPSQTAPSQTVPYQTTPPHPAVDPYEGGPYPAGQPIYAAQRPADPPSPALQAEEHPTEGSYRLVPPRPVTR